MPAGLGRSSGPVESRIGVSVQPGQTAITCTPWAFASPPSASESPTTACFVATYGVRYGGVVRPATEAVLTMLPLPCRAITG